MTPVARGTCSGRASGSDLGELFLVFGLFKGVISLKKHRDKQHQQLKDHIDYKFKQLAEKTDE